MTITVTVASNESNDLPFRFMTINISLDGVYTLVRRDPIAIFQ